jgi:hypothetical protein
MSSFAESGRIGHRSASEHEESLRIPAACRGMPLARSTRGFAGTRRHAAHHGRDLGRASGWAKTQPGEARKAAKRRKAGRPARPAGRQSVWTAALPPLAIILRRAPKARMWVDGNGRRHLDAAKPSGGLTRDLIRAGFFRFPQSARRSAAIIFLRVRARPAGSPWWLHLPSAHILQLCVGTTRLATFTEGESRVGDSAVP